MTIFDGIFFYLIGAACGAYIGNRFERNTWPLIYKGPWKSAFTYMGAVAWPLSIPLIIFESFLPTSTLSRKAEGTVSTLQAPVVYIYEGIQRDAEENLRRFPKT